MNPTLQPTVNLDSEAIRRIREDKKLTQLYVAKVVGVTTDTVSRWENNRYPSIKRDNALKLAEALEVPIADILEKSGDDEQGEGEQEGIRQETIASSRVSPRALWLASVLIVVVVGGFFLLRPARESIPLGEYSGERFLPNFAAPGDVIPVRIRLAADTSVKGFILRETFPLGWQLVEASPPPSSTPPPGWGRPPRSRRRCCWGTTRRPCSCWKAHRHQRA